MLAEHAAYVSWMRAVVAILLLFVGPNLALGQGPTSDATGHRAAHVTAGAAATDSPRLATDVEPAIRWLPEDTETIVVAQGPLEDGILKDFRGPPPDPAVSLNPAPPPSPPPAPANGNGPFCPPASSSNPPPPAGANGLATLAPPSLTIEAAQVPRRDFRQEMLGSSLHLFGLAGEAFAQNIAKHRIRFVVAAARRFGRPVIGGASTYEGCDLIVFDNAVPDVALKAREQEKLSIEQIENNRVVRIDTDVEWGEKDEKLSIWFAKPKPNILIAATDAVVVKTILYRIARPAASPSPLLNFPEWKYVDTKAPVWGIRHRRTAAPFYYVFKGNADFASAMSKLVGVSFSYRPRPKTSVQLHFHCTDKPENVLPSIFGKSYDIKPIGPLVAEGRMVIHKQSERDAGQMDTPDGTSFMVQHFMGYVVCP